MLHLAHSSKRQLPGRPFQDRPHSATRKALTIILLSTMIAACGGGGGSSSSLVPPNQDSSGTQNTETDFEAGVFRASSTFKDLCGIPRSNTADDNFLDTQGTFEDETNWLRSWSNETYLWYQEIEDRDPALYGSSSAQVAEYFELLKTNATTASGNSKDRYHYTLNTEDYRAQSELGITYGYGMTYQLIRASPPRELVIALVVADSPAAQAGITRGTKIVSVDSVDLVDGSDAEALNNGLWPDSINELHSFEVIDPGSTEPRAVQIRSDQITDNPVPVTTILDTDNGKVGYLLFTQHILTAEQKLVDAIDDLNTAGITDLVLDLRYNQGGYLNIANQLSYMIAGAGVSGQTFGTLQFNDKNPVINPITGAPLNPTPFQTTTNSALPLNSALPTLDLPIKRVFVLTTARTCSASEAIINGLRGVDVEVIQFGTGTCGKPYGFYPQDNCGTTYFTTQFRGVNAKGFGDYPDGFSPSNSTQSTIGVTLPGCQVADEYTPLGVPTESMLAAALAYRDNPGNCPDATSQGISGKTFQVNGGFDSGLDPIGGPAGFMDDMMLRLPNR